MTRAQRTVQGKWVIIGVAAVALVMSTGAWLYYYNRQRRPFEILGPDAARLVIQAPRVEALLLAPSGNEGEQVDDSFGEVIHASQRRWRICKRRDVTNARGLIHLRNALLEGDSYDLRRAPAGSGAEWRYALRFVDEPASATLLFAPHAEQLLLWETGREAAITPIADSFEEFLALQFVMDVEGPVP